jgi:hypothetical protein
MGLEGIWAFEDETIAGKQKKVNKDNRYNKREKGIIYVEGKEEVRPSPPPTGLSRSASSRPLRSLVAIHDMF